MNEKIYLVKVQRICDTNEMNVNEAYPCISLSVARELKKKIVHELTSDGGWLEQPYLEATAIKARNVASTIGLQVLPYSINSDYTFKETEDSFSCVDNYAFDNWYINIEAVNLINLSNFPLSSIEAITK